LSKSFGVCLSPQLRHVPTLPTQARQSGDEKENGPAGPSFVCPTGRQDAEGTVTPRQLLQRPRPRSRGSGLPSPVLKLAWHLMHTYILELDIIGLTPGSAFGRAAVYSACVWRSLGPLEASGIGVVRRGVVMAAGGTGRAPRSTRRAYCPPKLIAPHPGITGCRPPAWVLARVERAAA